MRRKPNIKHIHVRKRIKTLGLHNIPMRQHTPIPNRFPIPTLLLIPRGLQHVIKIMQTQKPSLLIQFNAITKLHSGILNHVHIRLGQTTAHVNEPATRRKLQLVLHDINHFLHRSHRELTIYRTPCPVTADAARAVTNYFIYLSHVRRDLHEGDLAEYVGQAVDVIFRGHGESIRIVCVFIVLCCFRVVTCVGSYNGIRRFGFLGS
mmetsp:Transcript_48869/g.59114  ORF Transcript_48869/g.59114 Transcript_48869/m.59114 type:complete len:206 (-) Transcript_48869:277-894(-)